MAVIKSSSGFRHSRPAVAAYNKQLQQTVRHKVPRHIEQRAAAELRR
jgi:hypothetical protein